MLTIRVPPGPLSGRARKRVRRGAARKMGENVLSSRFAYPAKGILFVMIGLTIQVRPVT